MKPTRREALQAALTVGALTLAGNKSEAENHKGAHTMAPLDYGRSFICNTAPFNAVRFWVESRTRRIALR